MYYNNVALEIILFGKLFLCGTIKIRIYNELEAPLKNKNTYIAIYRYMCN